MPLADTYQQIIHFVGGGIFVLENFRPLELSFPGTSVPKSKISMELSFPDTDNY